MKNTTLARVFALILGASIAVVWAGSATSVARAGTPSGGAQFRYASGVVAGQPADVGPEGARDAMIEYVRAEGADDPDNPELVPPVNPTWVGLPTTGSENGAEIDYTSGAWEVRVSWPDAPEHVYDVTVRTTFERGDDIQTFTWKGKVDKTGRVLEGVVSLGSLTPKGRMPTTGDASGTELPVMLLVASLLSVLGAGAAFRWRSRVRSAEETYILS
ncbi:MAG TPA: hypothetical protein VF914_20350 [Chloroflexia bacterium]|jgi:hypothetical protein